jgi:PhzF family phenazine biosynthesis protein
MREPLVCTVDAFTDRAFSGNPTAVCVFDEAWPATPWLQRLAAELNLPATAFVRYDRPHTELRWFSPQTELALCGSGTLAAAHVLWETGDRATTLVFKTCAGSLGAHRQPDGRIMLDFPADDPEPVTAPAALAAALGVKPLAVWRGRLDYLVEVDSIESVRKLTPDLTALAALDARGVIVTAVGDADSDFVSRFFAPAAGIDEDPVTASAHCTLGVYWSKKLGKDALTGLQVSARGGRVDVHLRDDRVNLSGRAVTITRGNLAITRNRKIRLRSLASNWQNRRSRRFRVRAATDGLRFNPFSPRVSRDGFLPSRKDLSCCTRWFWQVRIRLRRDLFSGE